jgi:hypothetical protein
MLDGVLHVPQPEDKLRRCPGTQHAEYAGTIVMLQNNGLKR